MCDILAYYIKSKNCYLLRFYLLLKSYLFERKFYVKVQDNFSSIKLIKSGVPQGSVLGPVLYTIFTSDMPFSSTARDIVMASYADDTAPLSSSACPLEASQLVQYQLLEIEK